MAALDVVLALSSVALIAALATRGGPPPPPATHHAATHHAPARAPAAIQVSKMPASRVAPARGREPLGWMPQKGDEKRYLLAQVGTLPDDLAKAVDPPPVTPGNDARTWVQDVPFTNEEVRAVLARVVARVNTRSPRAQLALVSFENAQKTIDAYKTVTYAADALLHTSRGATAKVAVVTAIDARGNQTVLSLAVHNSGDLEDAAPKPAPMSVGDMLARFEPAVAY